MGRTSSASDPLVEHAGLTADDLDAVLALVAGTDVIELEVSFGSLHVRLRRPANASASVPEATQEIAAPPPSLAIASPLVGIFHPTVKPGDNVVQGQAIGAIEALGMPTSVDAPQAGTVDDLLVQDGSPVEYGQPLIVLRR
jgi:acetyl-CoA carboxylase biotin carboxyl carrier protein